MQGGWIVRAGWSKCLCCSVARMLSVFDGVVAGGGGAASAKAHRHAP